MKLTKINKLVIMFKNGGKIVFPVQFLKWIIVEGSEETHNNSDDD